MTKSSRRGFVLCLTALCLAALLFASGAAAGESDARVTRDTVYDQVNGVYECVTVAGLKPCVFVPTGACGESPYDYTNVTRMMQTYGEAGGFAVGINAGIFYNNGTPTQYCFPYKQGDGVIISNGVVLKSTESIDHSECDILVIDEDGALGWADYFADADALVRGTGTYYDAFGRAVTGKRVVSAVTGFVPIVIGGNNVYDPNDGMLSGYHNYVNHYLIPATRQVIGVRADGVYVILSNLNGWTLNDAARAAVSQGCIFAYNLDGGGSAETVLGKYTDGGYTVSAVRPQVGAEERALPTYIVFSAEPPVSAAPLSIEAALEGGDACPAGLTIEEIALRLRVTEYFRNANGKTSARRLYSACGRSEQPLFHCVISGDVADYINYEMDSFRHQILFPRRKVSTSPQGTLYYTKSVGDMKVSLINNGNTRLDGCYYDYSAGFTLEIDGDLTVPGEVRATVSYDPGPGWDTLTAGLTITLE